MCMTIKNTIKVSNKYSANLLNILTRNFNVVLTKRQH